ncbi:MAG: C10 family peptidase, partial [Muribaculaceae bacterium]|nr:C10 family peptidase [Muribaculaceae bacterium]
MNYRNIMLTLGLITLFVVAPQDVGAARLSPQQALSRVQASTSRLRMPGKSSYELTFTGQSDGEKALYVFNKGETGFIVVSADDRMPALLGYSDNGAFDLATAPPGLKWWLGQYTKEAVYFLKNEDKYTATRSFGSTRTSRTAIAPLVKTQWNQRAPYNDECPDLNGNRCVTGCVATAMAQVMKYHNYPTNGIGEHSYTYKGTTYSFNYGGTTFDWTNMLNSYDDNATQAQNEAVAMLMYACGVGVNMGYGVGESGASDIYVAYALKQFFNYDKGVQYVERDYYADEEWEEMIYAELAAKRPVVYGGQASGGGHEFVCDGYSEDGKFHINWGWGGLSDGYFSLSLLNPGEQGTGSFEGGYNSNQTAIIGIQPPTSGTTVSYPIFCSNGFIFGGVENNVLTYIINNGGVYNLSPEDLTVDFYMKAVSESGNVYYSQTGRAFNFDGMVYNSNAGVGSYTMYSPIRVDLPSDLPAGTYKAYPVFKGSEGDYQPLRVPVNEPDYLEITIGSDGTIETIPAKIEVTEFVPVGNVISGRPTDYTYKVENIGEVVYSGAIKIRLFSQGSDIPRYTMTVNGFSILAGQTYNGGITLTFDYPEGDYDIICFDKDDKEISDAFPIHIYDDQPEVIVATGITIDKSTTELVEG